MRERLGLVCPAGLITVVIMLLTEASTLVAILAILAMLANELSWSLVGLLAVRLCADADDGIPCALAVTAVSDTL